jgi:hypothetical protein
MRGKYITTKILLACLSKPVSTKKDIHTQLKETIAEHREIMEQFYEMFEEEDDSFSMIDKAAA